MPHLCLLCLKDRRSNPPSLPAFVFQHLSSTMNEKQTTDIPTEKECLQTGHRLLLNFLAGMAHEEPDKPVMRQLLPSATNAPSDRNEIILGYKGLMRLVDRVAWMLSRSLSPEDATSQTVG